MKEKVRSDKNKGCKERKKGKKEIELKGQRKGV